MSQGRIADYETGRMDVGDMRVRSARKLMKALGLDTSQLDMLFNEVPADDDAPENAGHP